MSDAKPDTGPSRRRPNRRPTSRQRRLEMASSGALILFALPLPLIVAAIWHIFGGRVLSFLIALALYVAFGFGATLVRTGLMKEAAFKQAKIARAAIVPYKLFGSIVVGAATFATAWWLAGHNFFVALTFGGGALAGGILLFGRDPFGAKGLGQKHAGVDGLMVVKALEEARQKLDRMEAARQQISQPNFRRGLQDAIHRAENVLEEIERDPRDLRRARKFLHVYLSGAADVAENFVETWPKTRSMELERQFAELLADMKRVFAEQHEKLLQDDELDLDVQMDVLRTRLEKEGVL